MLTIAALTLKETLRRRAPFMTLLVAVLLIIPAFIPITGRLKLLPPAEANLIVSSLYTFLSVDIVKFFVSTLAIALSAGAISAELERGLLSSILPKPISRFSVYAGKWLGLFGFCVLNLMVWCAVIWAVATFRSPDTSHRAVWDAVPYLLFYPAIFVSVGLTYSSFAGFGLAAGLSIITAGVGWSEGIFYVLNQRLDVQVLGTLSTVAGYLFPLGRMSRWVSKGLGALPSFGDASVGDRSPFKDIAALPADLWYLVFFIAVVFSTGAVILGRRDV
ncbi:MAG: ABC transporter permease subunit [Fibrella sp.]|nr:ABC transporter permease subunit [Armatimonadota bacterium]